MAEASRVLDRLRQLGADIVLEGSGLRLINGNKLPAEALGFVREHREAIIAILREDRQAGFDERTAIIQFDGNAPREWAEQFANILIVNKPANIAEVDWTWFLNACGRILDEAPERSAA